MLRWHPIQAQMHAYACFIFQLFFLFSSEALTETYVFVVWIYEYKLLLYSD